MGISNVGSGLRPGICTSTTRPTTPYEGQMIYETDTDLTYIYGGSAWQQVSGGTAVGNSGLVYITTKSATSGSAINLDNCFTSTYDNYRITISAQIAASVTGFGLNLRKSGTTYATNGYYGIRVGYAYNTNAAGSTNQNNGASWDAPIIADSATGQAAGVIELFNPAVATRTSYTGSGTDTRTTGYGALIGSGFYNTNDTFDGIAVSAGSQTFTTVTVTVCGYRK